MDVEKISESSCVDCGDEDFAEDGLVGVDVWFDSGGPVDPFGIFNAPEVVIAGCRG